jgi:peptidyl-prolyl cis-trans isomerase D
MAKNPNKSIGPTKKHLARLERERKQTQWIIFTTIAIFIFVCVVIAVGFLYSYVIKPNQTVATVNDERISGKDFTNVARFERASLVQNALQTYNLTQYFGNDPSTLSSIANQIQQVNAQLDNDTIGQNVINLLVEDLLLRQEAARRGITITEEETDKAFQSELGYYPEGTPTTQPTMVFPPTATLSPFQQTAVAPTATTIITETVVPTSTPTITPTATEPLTPTATLAPTLTPTPYTEEGYQTQFKAMVENWNQYGISEKTLKFILNSQLIREKVKEDVLQELNIPKTQEQVWARHIRVEDELTAKDIVSRLKSGEDFCKIALELSTDTSNKDNCGDLGWFSKGQMDQDFENAAFTLEEGKISDPVKTQYGYDIIWLLGHQNRSLTETEYQNLSETKFNEWLTSLRENSDVNIPDVWKQLVPSEPSIPLQILQFVQQTLTSSQEPTLPADSISTEVVPELTPTP